MSQLHQNLFFFYRGTRPHDDVHDATYEKQLEDNTTKSLIYVLEHVDRRVLLSFLNNVVGLRFVGDSQSIQFALQRKDIQRQHLKYRVALALAPQTGYVSHSKGDHQSGRPDAWIWNDNEFAILLENKIVDQRVTRGQIERHIACAKGWNAKNVTWKSIAWADVYKFFNDWRGQSQKLDSVTTLLINEFVGYLRMIGLSSSASFEADDFLFFTLHPSDRTFTYKTLVRRKLEFFTKKLGETKVVRSIFGMYGLPRSHDIPYVSPGIFRDNSDNFWISLGPKERRNNCHLTVRISEGGISLDAFAPHKSFTTKLVRAIQSDPHKFLDCIRGIPRKEPFRIRLREARYANPGSSYKGQRISSRLDYLEVHPAILNADNIHQFLVEPITKRLKEKKLRPEIFLVRSFGISELLGEAETIELVADAAESMLPYVKYALDVTREK